MHQNIKTRVPNSIKQRESESHLFLKRPQKQRRRETQQQDTHREMPYVKNATANRGIRVPCRTTSNVHINRYTMWTKYNWALGDTNNVTVGRIMDYNRGK